MKTKMIALVAALGFAGAAQAAEIQGPWVEARAGWDRSAPNSGLLYGAAIGYDFGVADKTFLGLQAGISGSTMEECAFGVCAKTGRDLELLARLGGAVAEKTVIHAMAGYANSRVSASGAGIVVAQNLNGFRAGVGVEQQFGGKAYGKLEYRYTTYESGGGSRHQISASLGVRF